MSKLQNDYTTPEQSKRLLELGVPADSANFYYDDENEVQIVRDPEFELQSKGYFPCWSVGRLIEIYSIITGRKEFTLRTVDTLTNEVIYMLNVAIKHEELDFSKLENLV